MKFIKLYELRMEYEDLQESARVVRIDLACYQNRQWTTGSVSLGGNEFAKGIHALQGKLAGCLFRLREIEELEI